jgi:hypothetical protein
MIFIPNVTSSFETHMTPRAPQDRSKTVESLEVSSAMRCGIAFDSIAIVRVISDIAMFARAAAAAAALLPPKARTRTSEEMLL